MCHELGWMLDIQRARSVSEKSEQDGELLIELVTGKVGTEDEEENPQQMEGSWEAGQAKGTLWVESWQLGMLPRKREEGVFWCNREGRVCTVKWQDVVQGRSQITECFYVTLKGSSVQSSSVTQSCLTLCNPIDCSTPGLPVHHQLPEFAQTHVH